jgi:transposase InsO family protein
VDETAKITTEDSSETVGLHSSDFPTPSTPPSIRWVLDTAASSHMTNNLDLFINIKHRRGKVRMGDDSVIESYGIGTVELISKLPTNGHVNSTRSPSTSSSHLVLRDVLYIPKLGQSNLLSWRAISHVPGSTFFLDGHGPDIFVRKEAKDGHIIIWGRLDGPDYVVQQEDLHCCTFVILTWTGIRPSATCLHNTLIPPATQTGTSFQNNPRSLNVTNALSPNQQSKNHSHLSSTKQKPLHAKRPFELIHSDLSGRWSQPSFGKSEYYITFVDDYSKYTWVKFLRRKSDATKAIHDFVSEHDRQGQSILRFRTDNGGEYVNKELEGFFQSKGIIHELTPAYSHESNGVAERYNRTIVTMVRGMINELPLALWSEAINTAVYIKNRIPHKAVKESTPYEVIHGNKPSIRHLQPFGRKCFVHIPEEKRPSGSKLLPRAVEGKFIGYSTSNRIFRIYIPSQHRVTETRQVRFSQLDSGEVTPLPLPNPIPNTHQYLLLHLSGPETKNLRLISRRTNFTVKQKNMSSLLSLNHKTLTRIPPLNVRYVHQGLLQVLSRHKFPKNLGRLALVPDALSAHHSTTAVSHLYLSEDSEPRTYKQAISGTDAARWNEAMEEEISALRRNDTYDVVPKPSDRKIIDCKWIYKIKRLADASIERYKARGVGKGYSQTPGEDYDEIFAPVVRYESLRLLLAICAHFGWKPRQFDVKSAFLYGELSEDIYMRPLPGYEEDGMVWKLKKCLYGLKQSAREWYAKLSRSLLAKGFRTSNFDPCVFVHHSERIYISIYVDDIGLYAAPAPESPIVDRIINHLKREFEITDLGIATWLLGLHINYSDEGISLSQRAYIDKVLKQYGMESSRPVSTPLDKGNKLYKGTIEDRIDNPEYYQAIIGSLMYLVTGTRPDLAHTVSLLSQFSSCPTEAHLTAVKHTLRYLNKTKDWTLFYPANEPLVLEGYADADYAACLDTRRSFSGYVFRLGKSVISWRSRKQTSVSTSTTESEYVALSLACRQMQWFQKAFADLRIDVQCALRCDNTGAISIAENDQVNDRTKHIDVHYHKVREEYRKGTFELLYVSSGQNLADICTKTLPKPTHEDLASTVRCAH